MRKRLLSLALALAMCLTLLPVSALAADGGFSVKDGGLWTCTVPGGGAAIRYSSAALGTASANAFTGVPSEQQAYQSIIAMKAQYPEGMQWTNDNYYRWNGGIFSGGFGCAGFAFLLSDAAFGNLPARKLTGVTLSDVRVGDILRINQDTHSVVVLEVHDSYVVIAEGNYNRSIHWGRTLNSTAVQSADYLLTRYPSAAPSVSFTDVNAGDYFADAVAWALEQDVTNGATPTTFAPGQTCTHAQILTFLYRADRNEGAAEAADMDKAVSWAKEKGMIGASFDGGRPCTRAEAVNYIWQALGKQEAKAGSFTDVPANAAYAKAVSWAVANGVTNGTNSAGTTFSPNDICTRGHIVTFLHRAYVPEARLK